MAALIGLTVAQCALGVEPPATQPATQEASGPADSSAKANPPATQESPAKSDLSDLSLEDLMNVQVTSVSKQAEKIADAPAAVTVISPEDIQRSGLGSIPELLRL